MDFLTLPRRDLQALCKRNGVRANMTNAAMADALCALPKVDGMEEYVKQPVPVPEPEVKAVVDEQNTGKQGSPLRRGRRGVAKASEPIDLEEDKEEEKGNVQRQSNTEDEQELGVGRRGASRRARPVPVVPQPAAVAEEDSEGEEDLKREAKRQKAPAPVVGRRGGSRRARPSPAVAEPAPKPEVAGAEEKQRDEELEDLKREASLDDVPPLGVGRRGASRRARPAPSVASLAGKAVREEEQRAPIPRGRRVKAMGSSAEPIRLGDSDDEEKEEAKPEEDQKDAQILGVGRGGGCSRRAQAAPAAAKAEEEQRAPVPRARRVEANSTELIRLDDSKEEKKEDTMPEEERGYAPAIGVRRCGASRRAPALSEAPATRSSAASRKAEERDVALEDVPIRATRQRKPTMKAAAAAAAAEEKAPRRATRRGAVVSNLVQQEVQEVPQGVFSDAEAVGAPDVTVEAVPVRATRQHKPTMKAPAAATAEEKAQPRATRRGAVMTTVLQKEVHEEPQGVCSVAEVVDAPDVAVEAVTNQATRKRKPTMKAAASVTAEEKAPPRATRRGAVMTAILQKEVQEEPQGVFSDAEDVGAPVSYQRCDALEELEEASDLQKEELNEVDAPKQDEDEEVVIIEDEKLMEETPAEDPPVTDEECTGKSESQEQQVDDEKYHASSSLATQEESPILGLVSMVTKKASEEDDEGAIFQDAGGSSAGLLDNGVCEETFDAGEEMDLVLGVQALQAPLIGNNSDANHESEMGNFSEVPTVREEISEVDTQVSMEKEHMDIADLQVDIMDEAAFPDCSSDIRQVGGEENNEEVNTAGKETNEEVNTEGGLGCQEEGYDKVLHDSAVDTTILLDCSSDISWVEMEKAGNVTSVMPENPVAHADEEKEVLATEVPEVTGTDGEIEEKIPVIVDEKKQSIDGDVVFDHLQTDTAHADEQKEMAHADEQKEVMATEVPDVTRTDGEIEEKTPVIVDEKEQSMDGDVVFDHLKTDTADADEQKEMAHADELKEVVATEVPEVSGADGEILEKTPVIFDEKKQSMDGDVVFDHLNTDTAHADEQKEVVATEVPEVTGTDGEIEEKTPVIVDEKKQSMDGEIVFDHLKTDTAHADEQKEMAGTVTEVPDEVTGTDDEVIEERTVVITEDIPNHGTVPSITHTMDGFVKENHFGTDFGHGNEQKKAITTDIQPEVSMTQDRGAQKENALLDGVTESLSKCIITMEPSVCKNSSKINTAEPMAVLEEKGVKVASESKDLTKLSLGQLKAMLKEKLNAKTNKEAKTRVALARVDENVCRSHAKEQQQNLNLQRH